MLPPIKIATPEEISQFADNASFQLTNSSTVWKCEDMFAVIRNCIEVDPVNFGEIKDNYVSKKKLAFLWGIENMLRATGVQEYFYNIHVSDEVYNEIQSRFNAKRVSTAPEYRYMKVL